MDEDEFWNLVDRSREAAGGDPDRQAETLTSLLSGQAKHELIDFARLYMACHRRAYRWDCWAAGVVIGQGMTEDSFSTFRDWLISRGRTVFERAVVDPDSLADLPGLDPSSITAEAFGGAVFNVYEDAYGEELPALDDEIPEWPPDGTPWKSQKWDDIAASVPRLRALAERS